MLPKTIYFAILLAVITLLNTAGASTKENMSDAQKKEVEAVIQDYIQKNPEVLMRAIQNYQIKMQAEKRIRAFMYYQNI
jgi:hypothetical protein